MRIANKPRISARSASDLDSDLQKLQTIQQELAAQIGRALRGDGSVELMDGLFFNQASSPTKPVHSVSALSLCVVAQGAKQIFLSDHCYRYDAMHYLLVTAELPVVGYIVEASRARPYLSIRLNLDLALVNSIMIETNSKPKPQRASADLSAIAISPLKLDLLDAVLRLVRLVDCPAEAGFLAPLITQEIVYRLLLDEQGDRLRRIATEGGNVHRVAKAIAKIREDFDQPLRIETLAKEVGMSVAGFHHQFKAVTAMSPLQFQKRLRLQEARRLMLGEDLDVTRTAYKVGYYDASHFNREYKRLYGLSPSHDVERIRESSQQIAL